LVNSQLELRGDRVTLRYLRKDDASALLELKTRNRSFFAPYQKLQLDENYNLEAVTRELAQAEQAHAEDRSYWFGIFDREHKDLIGYIRFNNVVRGAFHNAYLGYMMDQDHCGQGRMTESLKLSLDAAFGQIGLHRVQAAIMPHNEPSIRVAEKVGFRREGFAKDYLCLNGKWEDHLLFAILASEWSGASE